LTFETCAKLFEGPAQAGFQRTDRAVQDDRHLVELEAVEDPQQDYLSMFRCQP